jgi:hypothetical protein
VLDQFSGELQAGVRAFMEASMPFEQALAETKRKMGETWGVSPVGRNGLMKYPPNKAKHVTVEGGYDYMDVQARQQIAERGVPKHLVNETELSYFGAAARLLPGGAIGAGLGLTDQPYPTAFVPVERPYMLMGDATTKSEVDAGRPGSYQLLYLTDQKSWASAGRITFDANRYKAEALANPTLRARTDAYNAKKARQRQYPWVREPAANESVSDVER